MLELARLNQLGLWAGEALALRLSGLSDQVILAVARRRAAAQPVLSSVKVSALKNAGLNEAQILADINSGISDQQADKIIAERNYAAGGHSFVRAARPPSLIQTDRSRARHACCFDRALTQR